MFRLWLCVSEVWHAIYAFDLPKVGQSGFTRFFQTWSQLGLSPNLGYPLNILQELIEHLNPEAYLDLEESVSWVYKDALVSVCNVFVKTRDKKSTFALFGIDNESFKKQLEANV